MACGYGVTGSSRKLLLLLCYRDNFENFCSRLVTANLPERQAIRGLISKPQLIPELFLAFLLSTQYLRIDIAAMQNVAL